MKLDVVEGRVTSLTTREVVSSNLTWSNWGPVAQWIEHLIVPDRMFPSSDF
jgi:hypothetical protein